MIRQPPRSTRFPYTTLCRSYRAYPRLLGLAAPSRAAKRLDDVLARLGDKDLVAPFAPPHDAALGSPLSPRETEVRSAEHTSELQSRQYLVCRLLLDTNISCP